MWAALGFLGGIGGAVYTLSGPVTDWVESAPQKMKVAEYKQRGVTQPLEKMQEAAEEVDQVTSAQGDGGQTVAVQDEEPMGSVLVRKIVHMLPQFHHWRKAVQIIRSIERGRIGAAPTFWQ